MKQIQISIAHHHYPHQQNSLNHPVTTPNLATTETHHKNNHYQNPPK